MKYFCVVFFGLFFCMSIVAQNDTCPEIVVAAIERVNEVCTATGRNQACYGNSTLTIDSQSETTDVEFDTPGDVVDLAQISTIYVGEMNENSGEWGISLLKLQGNLPNTVPGQNVTFILFGDVTLETATVDSPSIDATIVSDTNNINVRAGASPNEPLVMSLPSGESVSAVGRNEMGDWILIQLPDNGDRGWVAEFLLQTDGDFNTLSVVNDEELSATLPAFYLTTGIGDSQCTEAPSSGVLIQTPEGFSNIVFVINGVTINLSSTAYLQAQRDGDFTVNTLEGSVQMGVLGVERVIPVGGRSRVTLDNDLNPTAPPTFLEPYNIADIQPLPLALLPRAIQIMPASWWLGSDFPNTPEEAAALFGGNPENWTQLQGENGLVNGWSLSDSGTTQVLRVPIGWLMDYWDGSVAHNGATGLCGAEPPEERSDVFAATMWFLQPGSADYARCVGG